MTKADVLKNPINFLYVFSNEKFEALVAKYISKKAANAIAKKKENQVKCLTIAYDGNNNLNQAYNEVANAIQSQFGYTPQAILNKLLAGESVAGKNWKEGVYGVGATKPTTYADNSGISVDATTGKLYQNGEELSGGTPIYGNSGKSTKIKGYSYTTESGSVYTTNKSLSGNYYASTYGTSEGMFSADGTPIDASETSSVWENILTIAPFIEKLIAWIASLAAAFKISFNSVTQSDTAPSQTEFLTESSDSDISLSSVGILGVALVGGYLLWGRNEGKNGKIIKFT